MLCRETENRNSWKCLWVWPSMLPLLSLSGSGHLSGMGSLADLCLKWICPASAKQAERGPGKPLPGSDLPGLHPKSWIFRFQGHVLVDSRLPRLASRPSRIPDLRGQPWLSADSRPPQIIGGQANPCQGRYWPGRQAAWAGLASLAWAGTAWWVYPQNVFWA